MIKRVFILVNLCLAGCAVNEDELRRALTERAAFDLNCPNEKINTKLLQGDEYDDEYIYGSEGCGRRQVYQVITHLDSFKIYKEGTAPSKVIINNHTNVTAPAQVAVPPLSTQFK
jgi:hypothetical protein